MQLDFHYYATYCAAYIAGHPHEESLRIAYSAQFVDCCSRTFLAKIGGPSSAATTQLQLELMEANTDPVGLQDMIGYGVASILFYSVGSMILGSLVYALMYLYEHREGRLRDITFNEIRNLLMRNIKRFVILVLIGLIFVAILVALFILMVMASPYLFFITYIGALVILVPISLAAPIYLFENVNVLEAYFKAIRLGFKTWGGVLAVFIVLSLIATVLQMITTIPWEIAMLFKNMFGAADAENAITSSVGYSFLTYILGVIQCYGAYLVYAILFIGNAYQYGHASEKIDRVTVENDIEHFETL